MGVSGVPVIRSLFPREGWGGGGKPRVCFGGIPNVQAAFSFAETPFQTALFKAVGKRRVHCPQCAVAVAVGLGAVVFVEQVVHVQ